MLIRNELEVGDIGRITYLHGVLYAKEYGYDYTFEAYVAEPLGQFARRSNSRERIWVAEDNGEVLGSIALCETSVKEAQLRWFLVSPQLRGRGVGKKMLNSLIEFSMEQEYEKISLWTVKGLDTAKRIYIASGFKLEEEIERFVWGGNQTEQKYVRHNK